MSAEAERCRREIAEIEALLLPGHPDVEGLCMALSDWWMELLIEREVGLQSRPEKQNRRRFAEPGGGKV